MFRFANARILRRAKLLEPAAVSAICEVYWRPVYNYVRAFGAPHELALDVTQGVFTELVARDLRQLDLERGRRFRDWLRRVARNRLLNVWKSRRRHAQREVPLEDPAASIACDPEALSHERLFDRQTALVLIERAWERLRQERYARAPCSFEHLRESLSGGQPQMTDAELAAKLDACGSYVASARKRLREIYYPRALRRELRRIGIAEARLNEELRALLDALC